MSMQEMKFWYAGCVAFSMALAANGVAFAEGSKSGDEGESSKKSEEHKASESSAPCADSALVCKSLEDLGVDSGQTVAHSCTTMSGRAGAWVCPSDEKLAEHASDQRSPAAESQSYREIDAQ